MLEKQHGDSIVSIASANATVANLLAGYYRLQETRPSQILPPVETGQARASRVSTGNQTRLNRKWKSLSRGASPERLWGISERASVRLVFLFLGGFLLGCHEVFPPFERFVLPRFSTGHLDARTTQLVV
jgi:hypothetical protein